MSEQQIKAFEADVKSHNASRVPVRPGNKNAKGRPLKANEKPKQSLLTPGEPRVAYTLAEFCEAHRISVAQYYRLKAQKLTPPEIKAGAKIIISVEAAAAWRAMMTARSQQS
jgi:hypothetical protein